jgi:hypothetical protein
MYSQTVKIDFTKVHNDDMCVCMGRIELFFSYSQSGGVCIKLDVDFSP